MAQAVAFILFGGPHVCPSRGVNLSGSDRIFCGDEKKTIHDTQLLEIQRMKI